MACGEGGRFGCSFLIPFRRFASRVSRAGVEASKAPSPYVSFSPSNAVHSGVVSTDGKAYFPRIDGAFGKGYWKFPRGSVCKTDPAKSILFKIRQWDGGTVDSEHSGVQLSPLEMM